jgi:hypothetical protein
METKICKGPLHPPGGEILPLSEFTFNYSGPREGKPLSRCKSCRSSGNSSTVPSEIFMPIIDNILLEKDIKEASKLLGINIQALKDMQSGKRKRIHKKTFFALKRAESSLPREKISIGPKWQKTQRESNKLSYEDRIALKKLISVVQKDRYKKDKQLLRHVV